VIFTLPYEDSTAVDSGFDTLRSFTSPPPASCLASAAVGTLGPTDFTTGWDCDMEGLELLMLSGEANCASAARVGQTNQAAEEG